MQSTIAQTGQQEAKELFRQLGFKDPDSLINKLCHLGQRWKNRFTPEQSFVKYYLEGRLKILADLEILNNGETHCYSAIFHRADPAIIKSGFYCPVIINKRKVWDAHNGAGDDDPLMFIHNIEIMNGIKQVIPSRVWFQRPDYIDDFVSGEVYLSVRDRVLKSIHPTTERELNLVRIVSMRTDDFKDHEVERRPKVMDNIADYAGPTTGDFFLDTHGQVISASISIFLDNQSVRITFDVPDNLVIKVTDVAVGPLNF